MRTTLLVLPALIGAATALPSQGVRMVDEGSFLVSINGQRAGREDFTIRATPRGASTEYAARATIVYGDRRLSPVLMADSTGRPVTYEVSVQVTGSTNEHWKGSIVRGRVSATMDTPRGPAAREYIVADDAVIIDDDVFHQYYFLARQRPSGAVSVIVPRRNTQVRLQVTNAGADRVTIGTQELDATRLVLREPSGEQREVWVDSQSRVLRVAIPARGVLAVRADPPR
jgi:hypothetical protein